MRDDSWPVLTLTLCLLLPSQHEPARWHVSREPTLSIGSRDTEGPTLFGSISGAVRLSSGVIVVADRSVKELRYFSPQGHYLRTAGRKGGGPGEFETMPFVQRCAGDSVFVYDVALFRLSIFGPDGRYARAANLRKWLANGMTPYDIACNGAGTLAFVNRAPNMAPPPGEGPLRREIEIIVANTRDSVLSLGRFPGSDRYSNPPNVGPRHLGRQTTVAVGTRTLYVGTGDRYEVAVFSLNGARLPAVREERRPVAISPEEITTYIHDTVANFRRRVDLKALEAAFKGLQWPTTYPAYARVLVDLTDNLWIQDYPLPGRDVRTWAVYSPTRRKLATVELPKSFELLEAGKDYVFGIWRDEDGVEYVRQYALLR